LTLASDAPVGAGFKFFGAAITTRTLIKGEMVYVLGYSELNTPGRDPKIAHKGTLYSSLGQIIDVFERGGGSGRVEGPVAVVDCETRGGMSGGPVFDSQGFLIGVLSSGMPAFQEVPAFSYVSAIWPALIAPIPGGWPQPLMTGTRSLLELHPRYCDIEGRDNLRVATAMPGESTDNVRYQYLPWYSRLIDTTGVRMPAR